MLHATRLRPIWLLLLLLFALADGARAQGSPPPTAPRGAGEGEGPFQRLILRGATVIDGTGAPPMGPVDIVVEGNRIVAIEGVGAPHVPIRAEDRPQGATREIDVSGMYVLPGFVDMHAHGGAPRKGVTPEYAYKLWLAHGVTTALDPGTSSGLAWMVQERERSARNEIVAPRLVAFVRPGAAWERGAITTPELAREWVRFVAEKGADGLKLSSHDPPIMAALIDEAARLGLGTQAHLAPNGVARMNALDAARLGLGSLEHSYGLPEALFVDQRFQAFPAAYNYSDEHARWQEQGHIWQQAAAPGSEKWKAVIDEMVSLGLVLDPTFTVYEAGRDLMRERFAEWHTEYTMPGLMAYFQPDRTNHGSYYYEWTTQDEIDWKETYDIWMKFINDYKNAGGTVTTGSDAGNIYKTYGFGYIRELELLQEAGFNPLEVIRSATLNGAETLAAPGKEPVEFGIIRPGMLADLVVVAENPLQNLKVLYGTGTLRLNDQTGEVERVGGVKYTIKDGIVYDAKQLLADVARMVAEAKQGAAATSGTPAPVVVR